MPRGMSACRICGKLIPNFYRKYHERVLCRKMKMIARTRSSKHPEIPRTLGPLDAYLGEFTAQSKQDGKHYIKSET